uniref:Uncharacterized protein n=1 Tax=Leersia perrieri TaxID=77586 RepID=A0A0D9W354_9ORYZ
MSSACEVKPLPRCVVKTQDKRRWRRRLARPAELLEAVHEAAGRRTAAQEDGMRWRLQTIIPTCSCRQLSYVVARQLLRDPLHRNIILPKRKGNGGTFEPTHTIDNIN